MFYKLSLQCFDVWANELAPRHKGLTRFKEKFDVLKSARVEFPLERKHYNEGLTYILESLNEIEISLCDFTEEFSEFPSRIEASALNISLPNYDNVLVNSEPHASRHKPQSNSTAIHLQPPIAVNNSHGLLRHQSLSGLQYMASEIQEVVESQEYSEIAAEESRIDTDRGRESINS